MMRLTCLICLLSAMTLACGVMSVPPAVNTATPYSQIDEQPLIMPSDAPQKPAKVPDTGLPYETTVTADLLNIRTGPSHTSDIIPHVWLMEGEQVTVLECAGVWGRVGVDHWVNTIYLSQGCE